MVMAKEPELKPLEGIRVVEFAAFHAGPGGGAILGDLGAEVIKIEEFGGDPMRLWDEVGGVRFSIPNGEGLPFQFSSRNKKGICLDIKSTKGREIFCRLIRSADVFLTSLRKSTKARLKIDYASTAAINPRIIHASVSGFGAEGPMHDQGAFDPMGQAASGMMFATGTETPALIHLAVLDQATSIVLSHAVLTALFMRERRGMGQEVHVSLYGTALWLLYVSLVVSSCGSVNEIPGERFRYSPLRNYYRCKDGNWIIGTHHPEEKYWARLCEATGMESILNDPRFRDLSRRDDHRPELIRLFDEVFATKTRSEWLDILNSYGLLFGPVRQVRDVVTDPQALANGYVREFAHPMLGRVMVPGYPATFSRASAGPRRSAPALGEHTDAVMHGLGYSDGEIQDLKRECVIR